MPFLNGDRRIGCSILLFYDRSFQNFHSLLWYSDFKFRRLFLYRDYNGLSVDIPLSRARLLLATGVCGDLLRYLPLYSK